MHLYSPDTSNWCVETHPTIDQPMKHFALTICCLAFIYPVSATFAADKTQRLLLIGQAPDGHPPGTHEYRAAASLFSKMLAPMDRLQTATGRKVQSCSTERMRRSSLFPKERSGYRLMPNVLRRFSLWPSVAED